MSKTFFSGPVVSQNGYEVGTFAVPVPVIDSLGNGTFTSVSSSGGQSFGKLTTAIVDSTATTVLTVTMPNASCSAVIDVLVRSGITAASHEYDSTRVIRYQIVVTRTPAAVGAGAISAAVGAQIATVSGGSTLTSALTLAALSGGATAVNTIAVQVTNVGTPASITETQILATMMQSGGVTLS